MPLKIYARVFRINNMMYPVFLQIYNGLQLFLQEELLWDFETAKTMP